MPIDCDKKKRAANFLAVVYMVVGLGLAVWGFFMLLAGSQGKAAYAVLGFLFLIFSSQQLQVAELWDWLSKSGTSADEAISAESENKRGQD